MTYIEIKLSQGNINQGHFYLPKNSDFFPTDAYGGKNKNEMGSTIEVIFSETGEIVQTDIDTKKSLLRLARGESKRFIQANNLNAEDTIFITKTGQRQFTVLNKLDIEPTYYSLLAEFNSKVLKAQKETPENRKKHLENATKKPQKKIVQATVFDRNPYVVAEVLERAKGICERCKTNAPFLRKSDGTPYLEVHHIIPLSENGDDTVENTIALCPNCHRELHFGTSA